MRVPECSGAKGLYLAKIRTQAPKDHEYKTAPVTLRVRPCCTGLRIPHTPLNSAPASVWHWTGKGGEAENKRYTVKKQVNESIYFMDQYKSYTGWGGAELVSTKNLNNYLTIVIFLWLILQN